MHTFVTALALGALCATPLAAATDTGTSAPPAVAQHVPGGGHPSPLRIDDARALTPQQLDDARRRALERFVPTPTFGP